MILEKYSRIPQIQIFGNNLALKDPPSKKFHNQTDASKDPISNSISDI